MRSALRTLLLCLLALAIPVQGVAAAARLSCGMRHHEMAASHHERAASHPLSAAGDAQAGPGHEGQGAPCGGFTVKCDACATCAAASAAAIAQPIAPAVADKAAYLHIPFLERHRAGELPQRLERPPRTTSL